MLPPTAHQEFAAKQFGQGREGARSNNEMGRGRLRCSRRYRRFTQFVGLGSADVEWNALGL